MDVGKLSKLTLARASVTLCKSPRCVRRPCQKQHLSSCWEVCKAICMFSMVINHLRAHRNFAFCALNVTTTQEGHNGRLPCIRNMGWDHSFTVFPFSWRKLYFKFHSILKCYTVIYMCHKSHNTIKVKGGA